MLYFLTGITASGKSDLAHRIAIDNNISVKEFTKNLTIPDKERKTKQEKLFAQDPILKISNLKTYFPLKNGFFGGTTGYVKAVDAVTFDVFPKETLGLVGDIKLSPILKV